jgi:ribose/xylose/arabinose/galactoside ABC-type transport system permease subunit
MSATTTSQRRGVTTNLSRARALSVVAQVWPWLFLLLLVAYFSVTGTGFFTVRNFGNILVTSTLVMLMATGQTYVIITGGIDLSIGYTVGLASVVSATVMRDLANNGLDSWPAIALGVLAGLGVTMIPGTINGVLIAKIKVPPFIATLGMWGIVRGAAFLLTTGKNVVGDLPANVRALLRQVGNGSLLYQIEDRGLVWFKQPDDLTREQLRSLQRLAPYPVLIVAVIVIIFAFVLARTKFGRHTYAIGGSKEAALRSGVNVDRHLIIIYILSALTAGMAGVLHVFRFTAGSPLVGDPVLLDSVAAVVIGGTDLFGGEGRISGTVVGALIIAVLQTGLVILNVDALWQFIVVGCIIIIAVLVNQLQSHFESQQQEHQEEYV